MAVGKLQNKTKLYEVEFISGIRNNSVVTVTNTKGDVVRFKEPILLTQEQIQQYARYGLGYNRIKLLGYIV